MRRGSRRPAATIRSGWIGARGRKGGTRAPDHGPSGPFVQAERERAQAEIAARRSVQVMRPLAAARSGDLLVETEDVLLGVLEPGGLLGAEDTDVLDGLQAWKVVVGELDPARLQPADGGGDVVDLEAQRGVLGPGALGLGEQGDLGATAAVNELAVRLLADRLELELLSVEAARTRQVLDRKDAGDLCVPHGFLAPQAGTP